MSLEGQGKKAGGGTGGAGGRKQEAGSRKQEAGSRRFFRFSLEDVPLGGT